MKLVREHIGFERNKNIKKSLRIGRLYDFKHGDKIKILSDLEWVFNRWVPIKGKISTEEKKEYDKEFSVVRNGVIIWKNEILIFDRLDDNNIDPNYYFSKGKISTAKMEGKLYYIQYSWLKENPNLWIKL